MSHSSHPNIEPTNVLEAREKFSNPDVTLKGEDRAIVPFTRMKTFWVNTGTLCNIACENCYIESSPKNDALTYLSAQDLQPFLDELITLEVIGEVVGETSGEISRKTSGEKTNKASKSRLTEIGFTGGEPFMNPDMLKMMEACMTQGFSILVLTNAMQPMQRPRIKEGLLKLKQRFGAQMAFRISLDHYSEPLHDEIRGAKSWQFALKGLDWLAENGFKLMIAGRTIFGEDEAQAQHGYSALIQKQGWPIDVNDKTALMLFPEMKSKADIPEISVNCWDLLQVKPSDQMCSTSRMLVKRKGDERATVLPCTLITKDGAFDMGHSLKEAMAQDKGMFKKGGVKLCHPFCAEFCVLGGGSCTVD